MFDNKLYCRLYYQRNKERLNLASKLDYEKNKERYKLLSKIWSQRNRDKHRIYRKRYRDKVKQEVIKHYTNGSMKCACCNESIFEFLTVDHINGGGRSHRKTEKITSIYEYLRNNNFPEGYQILCYNCNCGKHYFGECPHSLYLSK